MCNFFLSSLLFLDILLVNVGHACSGTFWKKMEYIFSSISSEETSYLEQQVVPAICCCSFLYFVFYICIIIIFVVVGVRLNFLSLHMILDQIGVAEELGESLSQMFGDEYNILVLIKVLVHLI